MGTKNKKLATTFVIRLANVRDRIWHVFSLAVKNIRQHVTPKRALLVGGGTFLVLVISLTASFYWPRSVAFSYSQDSCFTNPVLLPNLVSKKSSATFKPTLAKSITVAGYPVYSHTTCISPTEPPVKTAAETVALGSVFEKQIRVLPSALPALQNPPTLTNVSTKDPLTFTLNRRDQVFEYRLQVGDQNILCTKKDRAISCDVAKLQLSQSVKYDFTLHRFFRDIPAKIMLQQQATTVEAVRLAASSIASDQTVFDVPSEMTLTLNKAVGSYKAAQLFLVSGDTRQEVPTTTSQSGEIITVRFTQPLARSASFVLTIEQISALDGGYLDAPLSLPFKTSGGPKALGVNIGSSKVQPSSNIVITFDSPVSATQAVDQFIRVEAGGSAIAATVRASGKTVTLKPKNTLARCAHITVKVLDGLQNEFGISGGSAWEFKSRVLCQTVFSIGTSVQGRAITAYSFGNGSEKILFVGTTHGDEKSSTNLLTRWVNYLESNPDRIPANRTVIIVPNLNPDGYAASRRTNAHNVDLNRNFPANNWKSGVTMPDQTYNPSGGGPAPLSEPESSALASLVAAQKPRLVLTYHAAAGVVIPNDSGNSVDLAHLYDQKSNVGFVSNSQTGTIFPYDTTGAFEDWLHDKHGIPTLLVELWTSSGNEYAKHQDAMLAMIQAP